MEKPLKGFRILDFTQFFSGPICTLLLADYGAEVIKIENPPVGDFTRYGNVVENQASSLFTTRNRGKKSIVLNMKDQRQKELFLKLVKSANAVVENFKPGTMKKFGITYDLLKEINPGIVYTSISGYGQDGPYADHAAYDQTVQAEAGIVSITGQKDGEPVKCGAAIGDYCGGLIGCIGTLMGIVQAQKTGVGRRIDVSMMDSLIFGLENQLSAYLKTGKIPFPTGNSYFSAAPIGSYICKDGKKLMISIGTDREWVRFANAMEQPQWLENPAYKTMRKRADLREEIDHEVQVVFLKYTQQEIIERMHAAHCVYGRINNFEEVAAHPQVQFRKTLVNAVYPDGTTFKVPGNPMLMNDLERETEYEMAPLGANTMEVLKEVSDEETLHEIFDPVLKEVEEAIQSMYK